MVGGQFKLGLFGVVHMDRRGKVRSELETVTEETDALFIEYPQGPLGMWVYLNLLVRVPAYLLGALLVQLLVYTPLYLVFVRDLVSTELAVAQKIAEERDLPLHRVDKHPHQFVQHAGPRLVVVNWLTVAAIVYLSDPLSLVVTVALGVGGGLVPLLVRRTGHRYLALGAALAGLAASAGVVLTGLLSLWAFLGGTILLFVVLVTTIDNRNDVMVDRIGDISTAEGYDRAVLITGRAHLAGLVREASDRGFSVPFAHASVWLREGTTYTDPQNAPLPELSTSGDGIVTRKRLQTDDVSLGTRYRASMLDLAVSLIGALVLALVTGGVAMATFAPTEAGAMLVFLVGLCFWWLGYYLFYEARNGQTPGKSYFDMEVRQTDGSPVTLWDALVRNVLRPVDFPVLYAVGGLVAYWTDDDQRLGDLAAGTVVVSEQSTTPAGTDRHDQKRMNGRGHDDRRTGTTARRPPQANRGRHPDSTHHSQARSRQPPGEESKPQHRTRQ